MFKNSILLICLVYIVFLLFISCLLIYMLNYLLFLSMVYEYAYFVMNIFGKRSIVFARRVWSLKTGDLLNTLIHHCEAVLHLRFSDGIMVTCSKVIISLCLFIEVAPQTTYCSCIGAERHRRSQHTSSLSPTLACSYIAACSPSLPFNSLHLRNQCNDMDYYSYTDPGGMEG